MALSHKAYSGEFSGQKQCLITVISLPNFFRV